MFESFIGKAALGLGGTYAASALLDTFKTPEDGKGEGGVMDGFLRMIGVKGSPETKDAAKEVQTNAATERQGIFDEVLGSTTGKLAIGVAATLALKYGLPKLLKGFTADEKSDVSATNAEQTKEKGIISRGWEAITNSGNEATKAAAEHVKKNAEKERTGIYGEAWELMLARYFPMASAGMDVITTLSSFDKDPESFAGQNHFETITAFLYFLGGIAPEWANIFIQPILKLPGLKTILEYIPFKRDEWQAEIVKENPDPQKIIEMLRYIEQLAVTSGVGMRTVYEYIGGQSITEEVSKMFSEAGAKMTPSIA